MKKNILLICDNFPPPWNGGDTTVANTFYKELVNLDYKVSVLSCFVDGNFKTNNILKILTPKKKWSKSLLLLKDSIKKDKSEIKKILKKMNPELIFFLHIWGISGEIIRFLNNLNISKIYRFGDECFRIHCIEPDDYLCQGWINKPFKEIRANYIIVNSKELKKRVEKYTKSKIIVLNNPVYIPTHISPLPKKLLLCYCGRIVEHKGVELCFEIINKLNSFVSCKLLIIGQKNKTDFYNMLLKKYAKLFDLDLVNLIGAVSHENIYNYLSKTKYILFPSQRRKKKRTIEGCPNIILETWAVKRILLTTSHIGHAEFLLHNKNCIVINSNNPIDWVKEIIKIENDNKKYDQITDYAYNYVTNNFNCDIFNNNLKKIITKVLKLYNVSEPVRQVGKK